MSAAIIKTLSLLLVIATGFLFQRKIKTKDQREGIKTLILSIALPATIFIALLQIDFKSDLIIIPLMSLGFNVLMYFLIDKLPLQPLFGIPVNQYRTLVMLMPSLAPGLSCFPFIIEYSGQGPLAMAALADVGNKIFVLIISYTIAMRWYYEVNKHHADKMKFRDIMAAMFSEPVNLIIIAAIVLLSFGVKFTELPQIMAINIERFSLLMTPLILLFIGLSMKLTWDHVKTIFSFLFFRSGIAFAISGLVLCFFPVTDVATLLLIVVFPQSACSFWPYAHMVGVGEMESKLPAGSTAKTFDQEFAMNVLACSMPFSVLLIMVIYSSGDFFAKPVPVFMSAAAMAVAGAALSWITFRSVSEYRTQAIQAIAETDLRENEERVIANSNS